MDKIYFRFNDGRLDRIGSLPKKKDGHTYYSIEVDDDGLPGNGAIVDVDEFEEGEFAVNDRGELFVEGEEVEVDETTKTRKGRKPKKTTTEEV